MEKCNKVTALSNFGYAFGLFCNNDGEHVLVAFVIGPDCLTCMKNPYFECIKV